MSIYCVCCERPEGFVANNSWIVAILGGGDCTVERQWISVGLRGYIELVFHANTRLFSTLSLEPEVYI